MKKIAYIIFFSMLSLYATSQPVIKFDNESYEFGDIAEGPQACYDFSFTNIGTEPLIITNAAPSCGCTTPTWSKEPIAPGKKGVIKACYNTQGRPGSFYKSITVTSNADVPTKIIYIKGNVTKIEEKKYTEEELRRSPKIVLDKQKYHFGKVEKNQKLSVKLTVSNLGRSDLKISSVQVACNCVQMLQSQDYIPAGKTGVIELIYWPTAMSELEDVVSILSNDLTNPSCKFTLQATVVESLAPASIVKEQTTGAIPFK